jgi:cell division protein FtsI/penicillin-binding protein 2
VNIIVIFQQASATPVMTVASREKGPALLSLIYLAGFGAMVLLLFVSLVRSRLSGSSVGAVVSDDLPREVRKRLGSTNTNRGLRAVRVAFIVLALVVFGFHIYWARYAAARNEKFQELSYKDIRNRRLNDSSLRGWILDRAGTRDRAIAFYRRDSDGNIVREYPMDGAFAQLFGSERGDPGLERALFTVAREAAPEALDVVKGDDFKQIVNNDVRLTIDRDLQQAVVDQLKGKHGAVVILNPQTGEVLAMYSNPSYSLKQVEDESTWIRLNADERDTPLINRALGTYYIPGSTFKTVTMTAAYLAGIEDSEFDCTGDGYQASGGSKVIFDDGGPREVHGRLGIEKAYEVSCNQYFAQMGVMLGPERLKRAAELLGIGAYDTSEEARRGRKLPEIWNASTDAIKRALAPRESTIVTGPRISKFDIALEGYGQGYAGQMTPFQMALAASAIANLDGRLMKPKIEYDRKPEVFNQVLSSSQAERLREIMGTVTGGSRGTARGVFAPVHAAGIITGGKTGTAQKDVPLYDPKTGQPKTEKKYERDSRGNIIREYDRVVMSDDPRIDGWFLCIAPLDKPQLAMAVIIEGGGYGSRSAAPVAAALVLKAKSLGLLK